MKIKDGFCLHTMDEEYVAVPIGKTAENFNGMIRLNETGAFIWGQLEKGCTYEELVSAVCDTYDVEEERAKKSIDRIIEGLKSENILV